MDSIAIVGGAQLVGEIPISGAKNSAIKLMAASLLTDQPLRLTNMPRLSDTKFLGKLLTRLGAQIDERDGPDGPETVLHTPEILGAIAPYDLVRQMRASFNVLGPLLARVGHAKVSLPGGCTIGARPVDLHLKALEALGAQIDLQHRIGRIAVRRDDRGVLGREDAGLVDDRIERPLVLRGLLVDVELVQCLVAGDHRETVDVGLLGDPVILDALT